MYHEAADNTSFGQILTDIVRALKATGPRNRWFTALCPFHDDHNPSLRFTDGGFKCMACGEKGGLLELARKIGIQVAATGVERRRRESEGLTLVELASAKLLPADFLQGFGVSDGFVGSGSSRRSCVDIPHMDEKETVLSIQKRLSLHDAPRFFWRRGDKAVLYGLWKLQEFRSKGYIILVEGASDCWTCWYHDIPAIGLPGASTWNDSYASLLQGMDVYLWHEPDSGGDGLFKAVARDLPEVSVIEPLNGINDISELYMSDPEGFKNNLQNLMKSARPASEITAQALGVEARESLSHARHLLDSPTLIESLCDAIARLGFAGDPRPVLIAFICLTSRLLEEPLNIIYISPSAAGKNAAVDASLPFFPEHARYIVRASSPRALVFTDEVFSHRIVVLTEADSLPEDGSAASAIRSLMSDKEMTYDIVEKGADGKMVTRRITKPGPTGLITTSTKPLGEQASTRNLTVTISDTEKQTRHILHAQADRANGAIPGIDLGPWINVQHWLELAGERKILVPFSHALADLVPANAVRMRRDYPQLLTVIKTIAFLHQRQRQRDDTGRIIATLDDYSIARWLLEDIFATTTSGGATPAVRDTVAAVGKLVEGQSSVSQTELADQMRLSKSTISYRVRAAKRGGWLVDKNLVKGAPAQLVLGSHLPDDSTLPEVEDLAVCVDTSESHSIARPVTGRGGAQALQTKRSPFVQSTSVHDVNGEVPQTEGKVNEHQTNDRSFAFTASQGDSDGLDEPNEEIPDANTQRKGAVNEEMPWDGFLEGDEDE